MSLRGISIVLLLFGREDGKSGFAGLEHSGEVGTAQAAPASAPDRPRNVVHARPVISAGERFEFCERVRVAHAGAHGFAVYHSGGVVFHSRSVFRSRIILISLIFASLASRLLFAQRAFIVIDFA